MATTTRRKPPPSAADALGDLLAGRPLAEAAAASSTRDHPVITVSDRAVVEQLEHAAALDSETDRLMPSSVDGSTGLVSRQQ
jgi:hypothetical protein